MRLLFVIRGNPLNEYLGQLPPVRRFAARDLERDLHAVGEGVVEILHRAAKLKGGHHQHY